MSSDYSQYTASNTNRALAKPMTWNLARPHTGNACKISDLENRSADVQMA